MREVFWTACHAMPEEQPCLRLECRYQMTPRIMTTFIRPIEEIILNFVYVSSIFHMCK